MGKIFYNGKIITMNDENLNVEAVYVKDGKIAFVGDLSEAEKYKNDKTEMVDLKGNTMFPGFFEPHAHLDLTSIFGQSCLIGGLYYDKAEDVINLIKETVKNTPKGKWIFFFGLDYLINRDLPEIDRYWLDEITTEHPIFLVIQSCHTAYANSMALEKMGINRDTQDTRDGHCFKDENGEPTGVLTEQTFVTKFIGTWLSEINKSQKEIVLEKTYTYKKAGITSSWVAGMFNLFPNHNQFMFDVISDPKCPIRSDYAISFNAIESGKESLDKLIPNNEKSKFTGVKFWYDGSPYTGNMLLEENYLENDTMQNKLFVPPNQAGERLFEGDSFYELIKKYHNQGVQISVHSQGDRASREVIDVFERVITEFPRENHRHRIEHCAFLTKEDIERCAKLGIELSFHINHIYYYGEALNDFVVGPERTARMMNVKTAFDCGTKPSLHSDDPMYPVAPLRLCCTAVTRTSKKGLVIGEEQALSVHEALKAITINAAYQQFREKEAGSIEVGKFADFTILKENPYEVEPLKIGDIEVVTTYLSGNNTDEL